MPQKKVKVGKTVNTCLFENSLPKTKQTEKKSNNDKKSKEQR